MIKKFITLILFFILLFQAAAAQDMALKGATILTMTNGSIPNGILIIQKGKITYIGKEIPIPSGIRTSHSRPMSVAIAAISSMPASTALLFARIVPTAGMSRLPIALVVRSPDLISSSKNSLSLSMISGGGVCTFYPPVNILDALGPL